MPSGSGLKPCRAISCAPAPPARYTRLRCTGRSACGRPACGARRARASLERLGHVMQDARAFDHVEALLERPERQDVALPVFDVRDSEFGGLALRVGEACQAEVDREHRAPVAQRRGDGVLARAASRHENARAGSGMTGSTCLRGTQRGYGACLFAPLLGNGVVRAGDAGIVPAAPFGGSPICRRASDSMPARSTCSDRIAGDRPRKPRTNWGRWAAAHRRGWFPPAFRRTRTRR